jgi:cohesin loading factor subunit SCC2
MTKKVRNIIEIKEPVTLFFSPYSGIRKLVMEVFQNMWFTPVKERPQLDSSALLRKVLNITEVVYLCRDTGLDWFEQLLQSVSLP